MNDSSDQLSLLALPSMLGLIAGMVYGVAAHYANLPMALTDHFIQPTTSIHHSQY